MTPFGLNGYMCLMTPTEGGYLLTAWHDKFPDVKKSLTVKDGDLTPGVRPDDRAQVERIFAPLFDELDGVFDARVEKETHGDAKARTNARKLAREARAAGRKQASALNSDEPEKAKDGTYPGSDTAPVVTSEKQVAKQKAEAVSTGTKNASSAAAADLKAQGDTTAKNEAKAAATGASPTAPANSESH
jgi:hypothetical protein